MKLHINKNYIARQKTGKGKFAARLVKALKELGVEVNHDPSKKSDIALHIGRYNYDAKAKKHVLRVGPANIDTNMNWKKINHEKAKSVKKADAIVYQSQYSKKIYHKLVCKPDKPEAVIFNGADPRDYDMVSNERTINQYQYNFLASTRVWLPQKRLKYIIRAFLEADISESCLHICGDTQDFKRKKYENSKQRIRFLGNVNDCSLAALYKGCDVMIHITYIDAFPNSVVEAQTADLPVICGDQGGTHEAIRNCGIVLKDKQFKYKPIDLNKPPKINQQDLVWAIRQVVEGDYIGSSEKNVDDLYIQNVARKYVSFFKKIL